MGQIYTAATMSHRGICMTLLHALLVFAWADVTVSQDAELSVGKVRSSADVAFSNGEIDQALKLWGKVNITAFGEHVTVIAFYIKWALQ